MDIVTSATTQRLLTELEASSLDGLVVSHPANVAYATGYRSVAAGIMLGARMAACVTPDRCVLVASASDAAAALDTGIDAGDYVPFGRFFFESAEGNDPAASMSDVNADLESAMEEALARSGFRGTVGVDALVPDPIRGLIEQQSGVEKVVEADDWIMGARAIKTAPEVERILSAIRCTEVGIERALGEAGPGVTERELAGIVAQAMVEGGAEPRFLVATTGPRSALSDARATDREWNPGELLRFDVGCTFDGYWSDIGRTAVLGEPSSEQARCYAAILAGEGEQLDAARPGMTAGQLFDVAVQAVEAAGLQPYRRHHCGHAIGSEVYERPIVSPGSEVELQPGMVFCVETPYYRLGWGGMMVEDAIQITTEGNRRLTSLDRSLRVVPV